MPAIPPSYNLGIAAAARLARTRPEQLRRADDELQPLRDHAGRRVYNKLAIERWAARRDKQRAERDKRIVTCEDGEVRLSIPGLGMIEIRPFGPVRSLMLAPVLPAARAVMAWYRELWVRGLALAPMAKRFAVATAAPALEQLGRVMEEPALVSELLATTRVRTATGWVSLDSADVIDRVFEGRIMALEETMSAVLYLLLEDAPSLPVVETINEAAGCRAEDAS